jgi:hypothetical protein
MIDAPIRLPVHDVTPCSMAEKLLIALVSSFPNIAEPDESEEGCVSFSEPLRAAGFWVNNPHGPGPGGPGPPARA